MEALTRRLKISGSACDCNPNKKEGEKKLKINLFLLFLHRYT